MKNGIIYIVFGKEYEKLAVESIRYSRQYTKLPIHIITNINNSNRISKWEQIENVSFTELDMNDNENRYVKVNMINYSPFQNTLFLDVDTVIQKQGIDKVFQILDSYDFALYLLTTYSQNKKKPRIYKNAISKLECKYPINIYNSGLIFFSKTEKSFDLMKKWYSFWKKYKKTRDMPPFVCAIQKSINEGLRLKTLTKKDKIFNPSIEDSSVLVQHAYSNRHVKTFQFYKKFGLPKIKKDKSFDTKKDWENVI